MARQAARSAASRPAIARLGAATTSVRRSAARYGVGEIRRCPVLFLPCINPAACPVRSQAWARGRSHRAPASRGEERARPVDRRASARVRRAARRDGHLLKGAATGEQDGTVGERGTGARCRFWPGSPRLARMAADLAQSRLRGRWASRSPCAARARHGAVRRAAGGKRSVLRCRGRIGVVVAAGDPPAACAIVPRWALRCRMSSWRCTTACCW